MTAPPDFELLETMRWDPVAADRDALDGIVLLERHLDRARASADHFGFAWDAASIDRALRQALSGRTGAARLRLLIDRRGTARCEAADPGERPTPCRTAFAAAAVSPANELLYHKTTARAVYDAARRSRPDADAVLLWNEAGDVTEGTEANVVFELDGQRVTPPVSCGLLAGTLRADLLARGEIAERRISRADARRAARVWLINSVRGWMEATIVE